MRSSIRPLSSRFGNAVRASRLKAGMTQMTLAERAELTLTFVGEIERGEKLASLETVVRLAKGLSLRASDLLRNAGL